MNQTIIGRKREWSARCFSAHRNSKSKLNESHRMAATLVSWQAVTQGK